MSPTGPILLLDRDPTAWSNGGELIAWRSSLGLPALALFPAARWLLEAGAVNAGWKIIETGLILAVLSLLVAREYLAAAPIRPRKPGLSLDDTVDVETVKANRHERAVARFYLIAAAAGALLSVYGWLHFGLE